MRSAAIAGAVAAAAASACLKKPDRPGDSDASEGGDGRTVIDGAPADGMPPPPDADRDAADASCPPMYTITIPGSSSRYRRGPAETWDTANADCLDDGATGGFFTHHVVLGSDVERNQIAQMAGGSAWIGRTDHVLDGTFVWNTDETGYELSFATGEPNDGTNGNCIMMSGAGEGWDEPCDNARQYFCECDVWPDDPSNYTP